MRNILLFSVFLMTVHTAISQAPEQFSYQAIIRNSENLLLANQTIGMQISILEGSYDGNIAYTETHTLTTNDNGLVTLQIGSGNTSDDFSAIDWGSASFYIRTETDVDGGTNYTITTTSQLLSVPYALYARNAGNFSGIKANCSLSKIKARNWGDFEAELNIEIEGGTPPYQIAVSMSSTDFNVISDENSNSFHFYDIEPSAPLRVFINDSNGLSTYNYVSFANFYDGPKISVDQITPACYNQDNGAIDISVNGGTPPYKYSWSGLSETTEDINNLSEGTYEITVTDSQGKTGILSNTTSIGYEQFGNEIHVPLYNPYFTSTVTSSCNSDGAIDITIDPETPGYPFSFEWYSSDEYGDMGDVIATSEDLGGLNEGTYYLSITNSEGCSTKPYDNQFTVMNNFSPEVSANIHRACTSGSNSGSVDINVEGGTAGLTFEWSDVSDFSNIVTTTQNLDGEVDGEYYLRISNGEGCSYVKSYDITAWSYNINESAIAPTSENASDGNMVLIVQIPGIDYEEIEGFTFEWSDQSDFSNILNAFGYYNDYDTYYTELDGIGYGTYYFRITTPDGCQKIYTYEL